MTAATIEKRCAAVGCSRLASPKAGQGLCSMHYQRWQKYGDPRSEVAPKIRYDPVCSVVGCQKASRTRGLCNMHETRDRKGSDMTAPPSYLRELDTQRGAHARIRRYWGPASQYPCIECAEPARDWAYDGTDPTQRYSRSYGRYEDGSRRPTPGGLHFYSSWPEFYMPMCRTHHARRDGARAAAELADYREWKHRTGLTLADIGTEIIKAIHQARRSK